MTNEELEQAFTEAQDRWLAANSQTHYITADQRYFFWAGSELGVAMTAAIYRDTYGETHVSDKMGMPDDVEGVAI